MRSRLATLALLALLAWLLFEFGREQDRRVEPLATGGLLLPGFEPAAVDYVSMSFRTGHVIDIERDRGGPWRITYPTEELAQAEYVEVVLDNVARAKVLPIEEQGATIRAEDVGLEPPDYTLVVGHGDDRLTLFIGERDAFGKGVYARIAGYDDIVLTTPNLLTMHEQFRAEDYVDKHLLRGLRGAVTHVRVEKPEGVVIDAVRAGDRWSIREPEPVLADSARVLQLVRSLQFVTQKEVKAIDPPDSMLAELGLPNADQVARGDWADAMLVQLGNETEAPARVFFEENWYSSSEGCYAIREDLHKLLLVDRKSVNLLGNGPEFFRERRVLPSVGERAGMVRVEVGGEARLDIRRNELDAWTFRAPERLAGQPVESRRELGRSSLSDFLARIDDLVAVAFTDPPEGEPDARLIVGWTWAGRDRTDRVDLFGVDGERIVAHTSERPTEGLVLDADPVRALLAPITADLLRSLSPTDVEADDCRAMRIHLPRLDEPLVIRRDGEDASASWVGDDEWGRRLGLGLDVLRHLRGTEWRVARDDAEYPWRLEYVGWDGQVLRTFALRRPEADEEQEALGEPIVLASWSGVPGLELAVSPDWIELFAVLTRPQEREPLPGGDS